MHNTLFENLSVQFIYFGIPNFHHFRSINQIVMPKQTNKQGVGKL